MINRIYKNAYWGIRGNYRGMPTDCPQRDERMGWLGDRAVGSQGEVIFLIIIFFTPNGSMILNRRRKKMELYPMWLLTTGTFALTI